MPLLTPGSREPVPYTVHLSLQELLQVGSHTACICRQLVLSGPSLGLLLVVAPSFSLSGTPGGWAGSVGASPVEHIWAPALAAVNDDAPSLTVSSGFSVSALRARGQSLGLRRGV